MAYHPPLPYPSGGGYPYPSGPPPLGFDAPSGYPPGPPVQGYPPGPPMPALPPYGDQYGPPGVYPISAPTYPYGAPPPAPGYPPGYPTAHYPQQPYGAQYSQQTPCCHQTQHSCHGPQPSCHGPQCSNNYFPGYNSGYNNHRGHHGGGMGGIPWQMMGSKKSRKHMKKAAKKFL